MRQPKVSKHQIDNTASNAELVDKLGAVMTQVEPIVGVVMTETGYRFISRPVLTFGEKDTPLDAPAEVLIRLPGVKMEVEIEKEMVENLSPMELCMRIHAELKEMMDRLNPNLFH